MVLSHMRRSFEPEDAAWWEMGIRRHRSPGLVVETTGVEGRSLLLRVVVGSPVHWEEVGKRSR